MKGEKKKGVQQKLKKGQGGGQEMKKRKERKWKGMGKKWKRRKERKIAV